MTQAQAQQVQKNQAVELVDTQTGLKNDKIQKKAQALSYHSTKTLLLEQQDVANLQKFEILKRETFDYFKKQAGVLNNVEFIKQLIADVEYVFYADRASGKAKQELVYQSFLQYVFQLDNITYDTYQKNNLIIMIDEIFKNNKKDLINICVKFHNGLDKPKTGACYH